MSAAVPPGYKQTEVGVIPENWDVKSLDSLAVVMTGSTPPTQDATNYGDKYMFVSPVDINRAKYIAKTEKMLSEKGFRLSRPFPKNSILFVCIGSTIGKCGVASAALTSNQQINAVLPSSAFSSDYLYYALSAAAPHVKALAGQQAVPIVNKAQFAKTLVPFPHTKLEQQAIAEALSDGDALIEGLEALIAKKRQLKQGAMQESLRPRDNWSDSRIGDLLTIAHGKSQREVEDPNGTYPILATGGRIGTANRYLWNKPSVLIGRKGTIDRPQYMDTPFWTIDTLFYSIVHQPNNAKYLFYQFCLIDWKQYNEASGVPSLNARTIENIELKVPTPFEQTAIATTLSDMDAEIAVLEGKLAKARRVKAGMMQDLLTGRVRLV